MSQSWNPHLYDQHHTFVVKRAGVQVESPWYFPSIGEYATLMEQVGFRVVYATHFDRLTQLEDGFNGLQHWLKMFAGPYFESIPSSEADQFIKQIENNLRDKLYKEGSWYADYKRIRVIGIKE